MPAFIWGFFVEFTGTNFYNLYYYPKDYALGIGDVPLAIAFGWAGIIYLGYYISTKKFHLKKLIAVDLNSALIATGIDFIILEPLAFIFKFWAWKQNNFWFGAPFFNFVGWFLIISIYVASYNYAINKFTDKKKQVLFLLGLLVIGLLFVNAVGVVYSKLFGWY